MTSETTVVALLFAAINVLVAVIVANEREIWVSGREFRLLRQDRDEWKALARQSMSTVDRGIGAAKTAADVAQVTTTRAS